MVQNYWVLIMLGLVVECAAETESPVRKHFISNNFGSNDNIAVSDAKPSFVRKKKSLKIGADANIDTYDAGDANTVWTRLISENVAADGKFNVSHLKPASFVRKEMSGKIGADGHVDMLDSSETNPVRKRMVSKDFGTDDKINDSVSQPASFVRKQMSGKIDADGHVDMIDASDATLVRKRLVSGHADADSQATQTSSKIEVSELQPASFIRKHTSGKIGADGNIDMPNAGEVNPVRKRMVSRDGAPDGSIDINDAEAVSLAKKHGKEMHAKQNAKPESDDYLSLLRKQVIPNSSMLVIICFVIIAANGYSGSCFSAGVDAAETKNTCTTNDALAHASGGEKRMHKDEGR